MAELHSRVSHNSLRDIHMEYTREPHIAGGSRDAKLVEWTREKFLEFGFPYVQIDGYKHLLSYPNSSNPNKIRLLDRNGVIQFESRHREDPLHPNDDHPDFVHAFLAYTVEGTVQLPFAPVYVNYGRIEDLELLENELGVSVAGKICIARYGNAFRGNKVKNCQDKGALGTIIFSDPEDVAPFGTEPDNVYPNKKYLPGSGIQRGGTKVLTSGDPLSPGWPSVENAYRLPFEERRGLPKIPAQPIGYDDAWHIMNTLGGELAPESWIGGLEGITYRTGGAFLPEFDGWQIMLETHNIFDDATTNDNVIAVLPGWEDPDRYVVLSNHRDAWGYGSTDPSSGSAVMMETARILGEMYKTGWKPRRTILMASWAAEEYGLLGSTEWVFDKMNKLRDRAVVVVNVDSPVSGGNVLSVSSSPSLYDVPMDIAKYLPPPTANASLSSYYEFLTEVNGGQEPQTRTMGSGSDHDAFIFSTGISATGFSFRDPEIWHPLYHTGYETFYAIDALYDPGFEVHGLSAKLTLSLLLEFADVEILPFKHGKLVDFMRAKFEEWKDDGTLQYLADNGASLQYVMSAVDDLEVAVQEFEVRVDRTDKRDGTARRRINDQMMMLERVFIAEEGLPDRDDSRHLIYSPSKHNRYGSSVFPGLSDLLHEVRRSNDPAEITSKWVDIRKHVSDIMIAIRQAGHYLKPFEYI